MDDVVSGGAGPEDAIALLARIEAVAAASVDPGLVVAVRRAITSVLGPSPITEVAPPRRPAGAGAPTPDVVAACVDLAEQFVVDVAATTDGQRAALHQAVGPDAFTVVQVVYVTDVIRRVRLGFDRLGLAAPVADRPGAGEEADIGLWTLLERFMQLVARLDALDPLTAELVRLRGARAHDCRLCRSRRSVKAIDAGGEAILEIDDLAAPGLDDRQRTALRLADALVTQPSAIDADLAAAVHERFSTDEIAELVLDVARNAANKIAVALGADAAVVTDGVEFYDLDATGEVVADADIEAVRAATG